MTRLLALLGAALLVTPTTAHADTVADKALVICHAALEDELCEQTVGGVLEGAERTGGGLSAGDFRTDDAVDIEVANFYFAPRVVLVRDGTTLTWHNGNPPGGNRHSVSSSDWGGPAPVLPVFVGDTGGGRGFRSPGGLQPGSRFSVVVDTTALDPASMVPLPSGDVLVPYHCYIHGASQMSGFILVDR